MALALDALHSIGQVHGGVDAARVELVAEGQARLARPTAEEGPPPGEGPTQAGDLEGLGQLLAQLLAGADGAPEGAVTLATEEGRRVAEWLQDPGPGGARASDAARALARVLAGGVFALPTPPPSFASSLTPLSPHRVALRMACQGAGVGAVAGLIASVGGDVAGVSAAAAGWGAAGVVLTLAEELARGRPARRWAAALLFGALTPGFALLAGGVAWGAATKGALPFALLEGLAAGAPGPIPDLGLLLWFTLSLFLPCAAFAMARLRGGRVQAPAGYTGVANACLMLCLLLAGSRRELGLLLFSPFMAGAMAAIVALLAGVGLVTGRALEVSILRAAGEDDPRAR